MKDRFAFVCRLVLIALVLAPAPALAGIAGPPECTAPELDGDPVNITGTVPLSVGGRLAFNDSDSEHGVVWYEPRGGDWDIIFKLIDLQGTNTLPGGEPTSNC